MKLVSFKQDLVLPLEYEQGEIWQYMTVKAPDADRREGINRDTQSE